MDIEIREFITYLHNTKKTSANTEISYQRDLKKMAEFLKERGIRNYKEQYVHAVNDRVYYDYKAFL